MSKALIIKGADFFNNRVAHITFEGTHAESISISPSTVSASVIGATHQLACTIIPSDAVDAVHFSSSDTKVATVSQSGLVTIVGCGTATITAFVGNVSNTCTVTVVVPLTTGFQRFIKTYGYAPNNENNITGVLSYYNVAGEWLKNWLFMCAVDDTQTKLPIPYDFIKDNGSSANPRFTYQTQEWLEANGPYRSIGWAVPIILPPNCTQIRFNQLNNEYGVYPMFFKSTVGDTYYGGLSAQRKPQVKTEEWPFVYEVSTTVNVPTGYDSFAVSWRYEGDNNGAHIFTSLSAEDLAEFTVEFL